MRLTVRLSMDTIRWINELEKIYSIEFGNLTLGQGHVVSKAYHCLKIKYGNLVNVDKETWEQFKTYSPKVKATSIENYNGMTSLNLSDETLEGIKEMQRILPDIFGGKRINTGYCIQLIVKSAFFNGKINN